MSSTAVVMKKKKSSAVLRRVLLYIVLILIAVIMVVPFLWMLSTSLKTQYDAVKIPPVWIPDPPQWENYVKLFTEQPMFQFMLNTIKIVFFVVLGQLFFSSLAAYSFARISFKGRNVVFFFYIATLMVPGQVTMIPTYLMFAKAGLTDNHLALILPAFFSAFGVFLLRQFFMSLPRELEEAAEIDGAGAKKIYTRIHDVLAHYAAACCAGDADARCVHADEHVERLHGPADLPLFAGKIHDDAWHCVL